MARCSDLPPELIALIINLYRGAKSTLRHCSLVCRAWRSPSQRRLFHTFRLFNLAKNLVPFRNFLLGAPHLGGYVREISVVGPVAINYSYQSDFVADATDRENVQNLFSLLPNITKIQASFLASSPFLFTNSLLRQCLELRKFSIVAPLKRADVVSPTAIFPSFEGTNVKSLDIRTLEMPSAIDSPLNLGAVVRSIERLTLSSSRNFSVWHPYFLSILLHWSELKILCGVDSIQTWGDVLRVINLSHLRRLHVRVSIYLVPEEEEEEQYPYGDASPLAPNLDHLLLTTEVTSVLVDNLSIEVVFSMVEWYLSTFTALSQGGGCTLKELTLTVMALDDSTVAVAWSKVDDILSTNAFSRLERVHFLDKKKKPIMTWLCPKTAGMLKQALPKLSKGGKLAL